MRKMMLWLFSAVLFMTLPALAQHNHGGGSRGGGTVSHGGGWSRGGGSARGEARHGGAERRSNRIRQSRERQNHRAQEHFRGGRFEHNYFRGHWGREHRFYWGAWGQTCGYDSWFFYNGAYFNILDPVPVAWCGDVVYVDEYGDGYVVVNPLYPHIVIRLGVRF